jgi:hypothetical protein
MGLEEIEGLRKSLKELKEERELNIKDALKSLSEFKARYDILVKENGEKYCAENCSDIIIEINKLTQDFRKYHL